MKLTDKIIIALDGYSSCGKSTFAKQIADRLTYVFIDTGAMYRAVSLYTLQQGYISENQILVQELVKNLTQVKIHFERHEQGKLMTFLNGKNVEEEIRGVAVSGMVSEISKIKEVRAFLVKEQQELGKQKGIVMDGRDIGTVVFPQAEIKLFMTASNEVRAERRYKELVGRGISISMEEVKKNIEERDFNDVNRKESPLRQASDAVVLDNSHMTPEDQMAWFIALLTKKGFLKA